MAGGIVACLAAACVNQAERNFGEAPEAEGGAGGAPNTKGGASGAPHVADDAGGGPNTTGGAGASQAGVPSATAGAGGDESGCSAGSEGDHCQPNVDDCSPNPCKNDGVCRDGVDSFTCVCQGDFAGPQCADKALEALPLLPGAASCSVAALNGNGRVAVGDCQVNAVRTAFWWKPSIGTKALPATGASSATALTYDGTFVVGYAFSDGSTSGVSWLNGSGALGYQGLSYGGNATDSHATAVSDDGKLVAGGSESSNGAPRAVRWVDHTPELLGGGHDEIYAKAMNGAGTVIVGYAYDPDAAIKWTPAKGLVNLPLPEGEDRGQAFGISHDGQVVVGESGGQALRWVADAAPEALGILGIGRAANETGDVIVGSSGGEAMIWDKVLGPRLISDVLFEQGVTLTGWTLSEAVAVSGDGHVVAGNGSLAGVQQAWLARLP
jgi:probable HAF family extracellular repeat protein